ncbi:hypothetical protein [Streptomyces sp. NPDC056921]
MASRTRDPGSVWMASYAPNPVLIHHKRAVGALAPVLIGSGLGTRAEAFR